MGFIVILIAIGYLLFATIKILPEYERGVIFRLGRLINVKGPGMIIVIPGVDVLRRISLRIVTMDVPTQDIITKDNVSVKVDAVVYYRVVEPDKAVVNVENYHYAVSQISQTTLRSVCGQDELDSLLSNRDRINSSLQELIDQQTESWGIKIVSVELKRIDLPDDLRKAMARQAEAEREKRAKVIGAQGEFEAATKLTEAANMLSREPIAIQLRYLETLNNIGSNSANTIVFPFPTELMNLFGKQKTEK